MIYSVVPKPMADELFPQLVEHYAGEDNVTVIIERREFDRRARRRDSAESSSMDDSAQRRIVRDRRRARVPGDLPPLARASA